MDKKNFGYTSDGREAGLFIYQTKRFELAVSDYGATLVNLIVKDKAGKPVDIVLGYDDVSGYESDKGNYFGCNVGRNANRIADARFMLNGVEFLLDKNDGENNLHSGFAPYSKRMWKVEKYSDTSIAFSLISPHMDQGYPGNLKMLLTYEVLSDDSFGIFYEAVPDKDTIINVTNHSYFNLNGEGSGTIQNHRLILHADYFTPADEFSIPTGEILSVTDTPMDFREGKTIGEEIDEHYTPLLYAKGYDHNFITGNSGNVHEIAAMHGDISGITMTLATDYPGVQVYTGNYLAQVSGKKGHIYSTREGVCFEPQFYPNAINQPEFISPVCKAGEMFCKKIIYKFDV